MPSWIPPPSLAPVHVSTVSLFGLPVEEYRQTVRKMGIFLLEKSTLKVPNPRALLYTLSALTTTILIISGFKRGGRSILDFYFDWLHAQQFLRIEHL